MANVNIHIRCQRCGTQMDLLDPAPEQPWPSQQFWKCPTCGRNFWTTYPPPKKPKPPASKEPDVSAAQKPQDVD